MMRRFDGSQYNIECITQLLTESLAVDIMLPILFGPTSSLSLRITFVWLRVVITQRRAGLKYQLYILT